MTDPTPSRPLLTGIALGAAHALLLWLAFPPVSFGFIGLLAPLPLLLLASRTDRPWRAGLGVCIGTLPFWAYHHYWVFAVSYAGAPPLILIQSVWPGLLVTLSAIVVRRSRRWQAAVWLAILWTGVEFLRGRLFFDGYPWFLTAHPSADLPFARWASVIGVYGLGFLIVLLGAAIVQCVRSGSAGAKRWVLPGISFILLVGGALLPGTSSSRSVTVGIVQTNLPQNNKMDRSEAERVEDFREWASLTVKAARSDPTPDLIIWPETMFPGSTLSPQAIAEYAELERELNYPEGRQSLGTVFVEPLLSLQDQLGVPLLLGALGYDNLRSTITPSGDADLDFDGRYNSAFLIEGGAIRPERYDKIFLTPFGETMPYINRFPKLQQFMLDFAARGMSFDLTAGTRPVRIEVPLGSASSPLRIATPICFEATIPHVCRSLVYDSGGERRAEVLINLTNDGWFGPFDGGRRNHLLIARWRAIELGTPVVRAANTGVSCVVDASGRVTTSLDARQPAAVLIAEVPLPDRSRTIYAMVGDIAGWAAFAASLVLLVLRFFRRETTPQGPAEPSDA